MIRTQKDVRAPVVEVGVGVSEETTGTGGDSAVIAKKALRLHRLEVAAHELGKIIDEKGGIGMTHFPISKDEIDLDAPEFKTGCHEIAIVGTKNKSSMIGGDVSLGVSSVSLKCLFEKNKELSVGTQNKLLVLSVEYKIKCKLRKGLAPYSNFKYIRYLNSGEFVVGAYIVVKVFFSQNEKKSSTQFDVGVKLLKLLSTRFNMDFSGDEWGRMTDVNYIFSTLGGYTNPPPMMSLTELTDERIDALENNFKSWVNAQTDCCGQFVCDMPLMPTLELSASEVAKNAVQQLFLDAKKEFGPVRLKDRPELVIVRKHFFFDIDRDCDVAAQKNLTDLVEKILDQREENKAIWQTSYFIKEFSDKLRHIFSADFWEKLHISGTFKDQGAIRLDYKFCRNAAKVAKAIDQILTAPIFIRLAQAEILENQVKELQKELGRYITAGDTITAAVATTHKPTGTISSLFWHARCDSLAHASSSQSVPPEYIGRSRSTLKEAAEDLELHQEKCHNGQQMPEGRITPAYNP